MSKRYPLVFFGDYWDIQWRRRQQLAWRLAKRDEVEHVLYVESPLTLTSFVKFLLRKGDISARLRWRRTLQNRSFSFNPGEGITVLSPLTIFPQTAIAPLFAFEMLIRKIVIRITVTRLMKRLDMKQPVVWVSLPTMVNWVPVARKLLWYDCTEDFSQWSWLPITVVKHIKDTDKLLTQKADVISTVSVTLFDRKIASGKTLLLLPNGVDTELFAKTGYGLPKEYEQFPSPRFVFVGMVNIRHDWALLLQTAKQRNNWNFVIIGNNHLDSTMATSLSNQKNIHVLNAKKYEELPAYLEHADACFQFYSDSAGNDTGDGQKIYLYLAAGKQVISTPPAVSPSARNFIRVVRTPSEMIANLEECIGVTRVHSKERVDAVNSSDWERRVDSIIATINNSSTL